MDAFITGLTLAEIKGKSSVTMGAGHYEEARYLEIEQDSDAERIAEKIVAAMARPFNPKNVECRVAVSIGISIYPEHGLDQETLMKKADCAMYQAKEQEGNAYRLYNGR